jgi:hypothetical protein
MGLEKLSSSLGGPISREGKGKFSFKSSKIWFIADLSSSLQEATIVLEAVVLACLFWAAWIP